MIQERWNLQQSASRTGWGTAVGRDLGVLEAGGTSGSWGQQGQQQGRGLSCSERAPQGMGRAPGARGECWGALDPCGSLHPSPQELGKHHQENHKGERISFGLIKSIQAPPTAGFPSFPFHELHWLLMRGTTSLGAALHKKKKSLCLITELLRGALSAACG